MITDFDKRILDRWIAGMYKIFSTEVAFQKIMGL
jgi:hypothetical protein